MNELSEELSKAWRTIDELRTLLRSLEWSGTEVVDYDGVTAPVCPSCIGLKPKESDYGYGLHKGHMSDCKLVAALGAI